MRCVVGSLFCAVLGWPLVGLAGDFSQQIGPYLGQEPPGLVAEVFAPGLVSTEEHEGITGFFEGGRAMVFHRLAPTATDFDFIPNYVTVLDEEGWTQPSPASFQGGHDDDNYTVAPDGRTLFFNSNRNPDGQGPPVEDHNIWRIEKTARGWSKPVMLGPGVNTSEHGEYYPSVTGNGTLYFMSHRDEGLGKLDIYRSSLEGGEYTPAELLPAPVNGPEHEMDSFVAADESYLIFSSEALGGAGGYDLFICFRAEDDSWSTPRNMDSAVNSPGAELRPSVTSDGKYLFFSSDRNGHGDVFWVDAGVIEGLRPGAPAHSVFEAATKGDLDTVRSLLDEDPGSIDAINENGKTALHFAAQGGHAELVRLLCARGAEVERGNSVGETPLHYAAAFGRVEALRSLLELGARTTTGNVDRNRALHYSAFGGQTEVARVLLEAGAEVNAANHYGYTALDLAVANEQTELAEVLTAAGGTQITIRPAEVTPLSGNVSRVLFPFGDKSNIAVARGDEGFLLVDTGFTSRALDELRKALQGLGGGEVRYLIDTHLHPDHTAGHGIAGEQTVVIEYERLEERVSDGVLRRHTGGKIADVYYSLSFGGEEVRLIPYPGIHTEDDLIVHFTGSDVVHMGDLLIPQSFPSITGKVDDYLELLDKVANGFTEKTIFVAGHGHETTRDDIAGYWAMLDGAATIIRRRIEQGRTRQEVRLDGALQCYRSWADFIPMLGVSFWVDAVFNTWEPDGNE